MSIRSTSKEALEAIRSSIRDYCEDRYVDESYEGTAFDAYQVMKIELWDDYVKNPNAAVEHWITGLAFGDYLGAQEAVAEWLQQTPEEADRHSNEQSEDLYVSLIQREFPKLAERSMPKEGIAVEFNPRRNSRTGEVTFAVKLYEDGAPIANVAGLTVGQARWLYDECRESVARTGDIPYAFKGDAPVFADAPNRIEAACRTAVTVALPYLNADIKDIDAWRNEVIDDDTYYWSVDDRYRKMENDPRMTVSMQDFVSAKADRYFEESGTKAAKGPAAKDEFACLDSVVSETLDSKEHVNEDTPIRDEMSVSRGGEAL